MPHLSKAEEASRLGNETRWATLGRSIADAHKAGGSIQQLVEQAEIMRAVEQSHAEKQIQFAGLARQIGDAAHQGKDIAGLVARLSMLRTLEIGPRVKD
jgi:hypothetical protein